MLLKIVTLKLLDKSKNWLINPDYKQKLQLLELQVAQSNFILKKKKNQKFILDLRLWDMLRLVKVVI